MNAIEIIFAVVLILVCAVIIAFTLMQEPKGRGLSGAITGDASSMIGAGRARSNDVKLANVTRVCGVIFMIVALVACIVSAHMG